MTIRVRWLIVAAAVEAAASGTVRIDAPATAFQAKQISRDSFAALSPAEKSAVKRAQASAWLEQHREELTEHQRAVVEEGIEFLSPQLYTFPDDPELRQQEERIKTRLICTIGRERALDAFKLPGAARDSERPQSLIDRWLSWFTDCVIG